MKVFEFANELEMKPLELVETLKSMGFSNVKNHMSALSDDEVASARSKMKEEAEKAAPPAKKKKVVKKKAAKKKVAKKVTKKASKKTGAAKAETKEEDDAPVKKTVVKRKTVVRKKSAAGTTITESKPDESSLLVKQLEEKTESITDPIQPQGKDYLEEDAMRGLQVVSKAEQPEAPEEQVEVEKDSKEYLNEKMHTFTPIFTPKEEKKTTTTTATKEAGTTAPKADGSVEDGDKKDKKRISGLAAMVAKPKVAGKARDIVQIRADEEMKTYGGVATLNKSIYTPVRRKRIYEGPKKKTELTETKESKRVIYIHKGCEMTELVKKLKVKFDDVADKLLDMNLLVEASDYVGLKLANEIAAFYGYKVLDGSFDEDKFLEKDESNEDLVTRTPIVTIMGHVDHGKTTLIDYIRKAKVADGEAGGITQHIGAYSVTSKKGPITFLDTPGHAAFGAMRQRGANVTDIVVLVVAADDGVMPQTKESIRFCQEAEVPIVVAVNKMDKEGASPDRVKQELMEFNLTPEEWGGETQYAPISALKGDGVDDLIEALGLQAEMLELKADPKGRAEGIVIESKLEKGRGPVCTVLIQKGTLNKGDSIVIGECFGRARGLMDHHGNQLKSAGPSTPVQILGLNDCPKPGDDLDVVKNEREAKKVVDNRIDERIETSTTVVKKMNSLEDFMNAAASEEGQKTLNMIIRTDVHGSFEAIKTALEGLGNDEVAVKVAGGGVGAISDNDVNMAESMEGYIVGFNMRPITSARRLSEEKGVEIKTYSIIYELINDVTLALEGMLDPEVIEKFIGRAEVRETFNVPKVGVVAGSAVIDGKIERGCNIRLLRDGKIVYDGSLSTLKRFKDEVKEVKSGLECGIALEKFNDVKEQDIFEAYILEKKKRTLESNSPNL